MGADVEFAPEFFPDSDLGLLGEWLCPKAKSSPPAMELLEGVWWATWAKSSSQQWQCWEGAARFEPERLIEVFPFSDNGGAEGGAVLVLLL